MKKILCGALIFVLLFSGCTMRPKAEESLSSYLTNLQNLDEDGIAEAFPDLSQAEGDDKVVAAILRGFTFNIISCEEEGDSATASLEITNKDMGLAMQDYLSSALTWAFENLMTENDLTDEEINEKYTEFLLTAINEETETVTNTVDITLTYDSENKTWSINESEEFTDAMFGGMYSYFDGLEGEEAEGTQE